MAEVYKFPRLYVETLPQGVHALPQNQAHYLKNVLRLKSGESIRVFHPAGGEFLAAFDGKSGFTPGERLREAHVGTARTHLYAPPLTKDRFDFLIEKATELGMTDFHPLIATRGQIRAVNKDRLQAQAIEAAEQCERLDIPVIHPAVALDAAVSAASGDLYAAIERMDTPADLPVRNGDISVFIGPPGGWDEAEKALLLKSCHGLSLGERVLRAETAALAALVTLA